MRRRAKREQNATQRASIKAVREKSRKEERNRGREREAGCRGDRHRGRRKEARRRQTTATTRRGRGERANDGKGTADARIGLIFQVCMAERPCPCASGGVSRGGTAVAFIIRETRLGFSFFVWISFPSFFFFSSYFHLFRWCHRNSYLAQTRVITLL